MLKPLADRVLVKVDSGETQTKGGILLPDTAQKNLRKAKSSLLAPAKCSTTAPAYRLKSKWATESSLQNIPAWISKKMDRNSCFSPKETYWGFCNQKYLGVRMSVGESPAQDLSSIVL